MKETLEWVCRSIRPQGVLSDCRVHSEQLTLAIPLGDCKAMPCPFWGGVDHCMGAALSGRPASADSSFWNHSLGVGVVDIPYDG